MAPPDLYTVLGVQPHGALQAQQLVNAPPLGCGQLRVEAGQVPLSATVLVLEVRHHGGAQLVGPAVEDLGLGVQAIALPGLLKR